MPIDQTAPEKTTVNGTAADVVARRLRAEMLLADSLAYFDHAAVAPLSQPAVAALKKYSNEVGSRGDLLWPTWSAGLESFRKDAAALVGAAEEEIALVPNTTAGINIVAEGFPWREGDNVVVPANEFPSNLYPWLHLQSRGVEVRQVQPVGGRLEPDHVAKLCDSRTRIVALSWVSYCTGWRVDVAAMAEVAHRHGALLFLDAIQGLGVFPFDVTKTGVDFLAADGHKWLLGPEGAGVFFCRRSHLDLLRPTGVGWNSVAGAHDFATIELNIRDSAARYEGGSMNMPGFLALAESLRLLMGLGVEAIGARVVELTDQLIERLRGGGAEVLSPRQAGHESGIVVARWPDRDPGEIRQRCLDAGVVVSCRGGGVRGAPHAYNTDDDLDRFLAAASSS